MSRLRSRICAGLLCALTVLANPLAASANPQAPGKTPNPAQLYDCLILLIDLKVISDAYAVNIVDTAHKVRAKKLSWADGLKSVKAANNSIRSRWDTYQASATADAELRAVAKVTAAKTVADAATNELTAIFTAQDEAKLVHFVTEKLYPAIDPITEDISKLIETKVRVCASGG